MIVTDEERHWSTLESLIPSEKLATYRTLISGRMTLRNKGVRFHNYFTPVAPCSPSRGVLYTGHHAVDNGVVTILNVEDAPPSHDKSSAATLCSMVDKSL